jgi:DNA invertase Pin-like site-specific DNA recombinase
LRVAGYARYSTDRQDKGVSIESQDREMREVSGRKGWGYTETYADRAISGGMAAEARPELSRLLSDAAAKKFERVLTFDASRLARDQAIFWGVIEAFRKSGVSYCTAIMPEIDSESPEFQIVAGALQGAAAYERRLTAKKVKIGMSVLKDRGHHMGRPPAGLRINKSGILELDESGEKMKGVLERFPDVKAAEVMAELSLRNYWQAMKLRDSVKRFIGLSATVSACGPSDPGLTRRSSPASSSGTAAP